MNYCPGFPAGETAESQEKMRVDLLAELKKRNNNETVRKMMDMTFAYRRHEIVHDSPLVAAFKSRWAALFQVREVSDLMFPFYQSCPVVYAALPINKTSLCL